jgi:deoxyribonuclease V
MKFEHLHGWNVSIAEAKTMQLKLAKMVSRHNEVKNPRFIAGVDISSSARQKSPDKMATAAMVVLGCPELEVTDIQTSQDFLDFPYIPGLLSFREAPLIIENCRKLTVELGLIFVDGQGIAHTRRFGLASHVGLLLDTPTIGCAKSLLVGRYDMPGDKAGSYTEIIDDGEVIGAAVRTRKRVKPVFISIGHKIDLKSAIYWTIECCRGYRLPEPTRLAHLAAGGNLELERIKSRHNMIIRK